MTKKRLQRLNWFYVPAVVLMILFIAYPLGNAIYLSFFKFSKERFYWSAELYIHV